MFMRKDNLSLSYLTAFAPQLEDINNQIIKNRKLEQDLITRSLLLRA